MLTSPAVLKKMFASTAIDFAVDLLTHSFRFKSFFEDEAMNKSTVDPPFKIRVARIAGKEYFDFADKYWHYSLYASLIYIIFVHGLKYFMKRRQKLELRYVLTMWNLMFSLFSVVSLIQIFPNYLQVVYKNGLRDTLCTVDNIEVDNITMFWIYAFAWSKYFELGDTVFIVLRKHPLIVLHWFHHCSTLVMSWYVLSRGYQNVGACVLMVMINLFIHSVMYFYFALKSLRVRLSRSISMIITSLQILQMLAGIYILRVTLSIDEKNRDCQIDRNILKAIVVFIASNLIFFINFYYKSYFNAREQKEIQSKKD